MTKQEKAEFIAKKVLGMSECDEQWYYKGQTIPYTSDIESFIYSPEGFFAVWDALCKDNQEELDVQFGQMFTKPFDIYCRIMGSKYVRGKDRYEAFYNAVIEEI